jgi:hypothetical protein
VFLSSFSFQPLLDFNNALDLQEVYDPFVSLRAQDQEGVVRYERRGGSCEVREEGREL